MSPFYAEELQNISTLRACISVKPGYDVAKELRVNNNVLTLGNAVVADFSSVKVTVTTDNLIVEQPNTATSEKDKSQSLVPWEIKLNLVRSTDPQQQQIEVREWWTAKDLLKLGSHSNSTNIRNVQLQCRSCFEPLVNSQANYTIKDLPSEHWYELIECWICHEAKAGEHKSRMQPILARPNTLLVGTTYFLLHTDNILKDSIEVDSTVANCLDWNRGTKTKWITLNCRKCKHALGEGQYTIESNNQLSLLAVKLFKYSTFPLLETKVFPHQPSFIDFFVSDLVSTARVHATHRFLIQGRQSHRIYALIWLFNWDTHIIHNNGFVEESDTCHKLQRQRVIKVTYLNCTKDENAELAQNYISLWSQDKTTDHLLYPDIFCVDLVHTLSCSTLILPPFMRRIDHPAMIFTRNFSIGFIPRKDV